jgi:hypothetical protein
MHYTSYLEAMLDYLRGSRAPPASSTGNFLAQVLAERRSSQFYVRPQAFRICYSYRNATVGLTETARRVGTKQAHTATTVSNNETPM